MGITRQAIEEEVRFACCDCTESAYKKGDTAEFITWLAELEAAGWHLEGVGRGEAALVRCPACQERLVSTHVVDDWLVEIDDAARREVEKAMSAYTRRLREILTRRLIDEAT